MARITRNGREMFRATSTIRGMRIERSYRTNGWMLTKTTYLKPDGKVDFSPGWKRYAKWTPGEGAASAIALRLQRQGWKISGISTTARRPAAVNADPWS